MVEPAPLSQKHPTSYPKQHTMSHYTHIINGKPASSSSTLDVQNPATQKKIAEVPVATKDQLDEAVAAARAPFQHGQLSLRTNAHSVMLLETAKLRVPEKVIIDNEQVRITERRVPIRSVRRYRPMEFPSNAGGDKNWTRSLSGQYPVLKPSPFTPLTTLRLVKDIQKVVPPGVSFTGSTDTGKRVMASASTGLKRLTLELGNIILPDVDVVKIVPEMFWAALINNGQTCVAAKRLLSRPAMAPTRIAAWPRPEPHAYKKVLSFFEDAKANGYKFVTGGDVNPNPTDGLFIPASFVDNPPEDSKIVREEPFGPIVPLLKWSDETDVIKRANDTNMGLASSVWGKDLVAVERIAKQIEAGGGCMHERVQPSHSICGLGGHKESGIGVENGLNGLLSYSNIQTLTLKKQPTFV
ncbi:aldehyde dehydrogenase family [Rhizoctonia solani]|uniref:Aldehyde dehydrogenase family n=1 Tax=Rhizoctonia solani TaxID=456999 RepID=A0A8H7I303_9AGAM|nr:aldehyde dehydrogenase family [Rhizoctonia solani]